MGLLSIEVLRKHKGGRENKIREGGREWRDATIVFNACKK